jgi:hypothetical protein
MLIMIASTLALWTLLPVTSNQQSAGSGRSVVVIGCVSPAVPDGSLSGSPGVAPATPATAPTLANSGQPTGVSLLTGALPADASAEVRAEALAGRSPARATLTTYVLDGPQSRLADHVGHWVEVRGKLTVLPTGTGESKAPVNHLLLETIRMLTAKCPSASVPDR